MSSERIEILLFKSANRSFQFSLQITGFIKQWKSSCGGKRSHNAVGQEFKCELLPQNNLTRVINQR